MEQGEKGNASLLQPPDQSLCPRQLRVPRRVRQLQRTQSGALVMSEQNLKQICETDGLYQYPEMNKKIYLHYKVIERISGLEKYINLKSLYLENNVITRIQGLDQLGELENLFLQNNMIKRMENLGKLKQLRVLNLSNNNIFAIEGLAQLLQLQNLTMSKNFLSDFPSLEHLGQCSPTLTSIDLADNKIVPEERLFDLVPQVKCIYLSGNPLVRQLGHYRRTIVGRLPNLLYLDQRAVDKEERIMAEAWIKEGEVGFRKARESILAYRKQRRQEERAEVMKNIDVHRRNKINVFQRNIGEFEQEIGKLRRYMREPDNASQMYFYETRISELMQKIKDNQQFIDSIYQRMGISPPPPIYTLDLPQDEVLEEQLNRTNTDNQQEGIFEVPENPAEEQESQGVSEGQESSNNESSGSQQVSESSNSQQSSVKTYYSSSLDELD